MVSAKIPVIVVSHTISDDAKKWQATPSMVSVWIWSANTSFLVDAILAQWETVIQPLDAQDGDVDDAEMGASSQDRQ